MDETNSTTLEVGAEQITSETQENQTTETDKNTSSVQSDDVREPEKATTTKTELEQPKNWEQIAKDNQAAFTRVSQELAELKKMQEPKCFDDRGKITPEYEQNYRFELDNGEYLLYDQLARQLEPEVRTRVEELLYEAKNLYTPNNKSAYNQKMSEIKNYFDAQLVEQIALEKRTLENKMQSEFDRLMQANKAKKAQEVAEMVEQSDDLKALLYQESENYSPEVFKIIQQMFDNYGAVDFDLTAKAIDKIKSLGVKEYLAGQKAQKQKENANVPDGENILSNKDNSKLTFDKLSDVNFWDKHYS